MNKELKEKIAVNAANEWCRCFKCDGRVNATGCICDKDKRLTCHKWYDGYRTALLALEDAENASKVTSKVTSKVSEGLEEAAKRYATEGDEISGLHIIDEEVEAFKAGAKWQKERIKANSTNATICLPYENKDGGYTQLIDVSRPLPIGNNIIAIIFKEE